MDTRTGKHVLRFFHLDNIKKLKINPNNTIQKLLLQMIKNIIYGEQSVFF